MKSRPLTVNVSPETLATLRRHDQRVTVVVQRAIDEYLARHQEPVPAARPASPAHPATEARASARARPRGRDCLPRRVPGGREE